MPADDLPLSGARPSADSVMTRSVYRTHRKYWVKNEDLFDKHFEPTLLAGAYSNEKVTLVLQQETAYMRNIATTRDTKNSPESIHNNMHWRLNAKRCNSNCHATGLHLFCVEPLICPIFATEDYSLTWGWWQLLSRTWNFLMIFLSFNVMIYDIWLQDW